MTEGGILPVIVGVLVYESRSGIEILFLIIGFGNLLPAQPRISTEFFCAETKAIPSSFSGGGKEVQLLGYGNSKR